MLVERIEGSTTSDKKHTLMAQYKAAMKVLKSKGAQEKRMQRPIWAKAKAMTKPKAKARVKKAKMAAPQDDDNVKDE